MRTILISLVALLAMISMPVISHATIHEVSIINFAFTPKNTMVTLGDTVRWSVESGVHSTTATGSSPKSWDSGIMGVSGSFNLIVLETDPTGNYPYFCTVHGTTMSDTLRVMEPEVSCCVPPIRGEIDGMGGTNILDVNRLVSWLFAAGLEPPCLDEANVDGMGGFNILDVNRLVGYLFAAGAPPAACP